MSNVAEALSRLTPEQRAILEKKLQKRRAQKDEAMATVAHSKILPRPDCADLPLSAGQERLLTLSQFSPDATTYNITEAVRLQGPLNIPALEESLSQLVQRQESLRALFSENNGTLIQTIQPFDQVNFEVSKLESVSQTEQSSAIHEFIRAKQREPFILHQGPLYRFNLLALGDNSHVLLLTMHHIIADAWSFGLLFKEVSSRYTAIISGKTPTIEPLSIQYTDFAHWQLEWLKSDNAKSQLDFWQRPYPQPLNP